MEFWGRVASAEGGSVLSGVGMGRGVPSPADGWSEGAS